ncbi:phosphatase PAP2 family protein [Amycolatopsis suaedae]|uniref:Phosphatase PAP2 family protein n=1 Tax=Amycolatopsis suaedae TaxID=2510978 RepID=A0A4Q7J4J5_9PSEU|nr:phosphatase PAP2 family protein [Amycolatopsis suaedae]RZQ62491.1 phosphatase PAP2 family protein [Amycolatopsis suaedae]
MSTDLASATTVPLHTRAVRRRRPELWAALGCVFGLALVCLVFVWTRTGQRIDGVLLPRAERGGGYEQRSALSEPAGAVLRLVGNPLLLAFALGAILLAGLLLRRLRAGAAGVAVVLGSIAAARVLKELIVRPDLDVIGSTTHNSFPSGHVAATAGLVFAVLLLVPPRVRPWLVLPGAAGIGVVVGATMVAGWHRLSDGLGAVLVAAILFCLAVAVTRRPAALR